MTKPPVWLDKAAQGLAFWAAYQRIVASGRPALEGALNMALATLILTSSRAGTHVSYEVPYETLGVRKAGNTATDFVVTNREGDGCSHIIELVRFISSYRPIQEELERVHRALLARPAGFCGWVIVVAQGVRPNKLVTKDGDSVGKARIGEKEWGVRRVLKASHTFKKTTKASYVCIIEAVPRAG